MPGGNVVPGGTVVSGGNVVPGGKVVPGGGVWPFDSLGATDEPLGRRLPEAPTEPDGSPATSGALGVAATSGKWLFKSPPSTTTPRTAPARRTAPTTHGVRLRGKFI